MPLYSGQGYAELLYSWGSDEEIIRSARMSTRKGFLGWDNDEKLLRYLYTHNHLSPFEACGMTIQARAPKFVVAQVQRHRAASYNEESARYTELQDEHWSPSPADIRQQGGQNKQGSLRGAGLLWAAKAHTAALIVRGSNRLASLTYRALLGLGVAREQARTVVPMGQMVSFRMSTNLRMWLHFLSLRLDKHAQEETRLLAAGAHLMLSNQFPRTVRLFDERNK